MPGTKTGGTGAYPMPTKLETAVMHYLRAGNLANGTRNEYRATLRKWTEWGGGVPIEKLTRQEIRDFLDWCTNRPSKIRELILVEPRTRLAKIFGRSCLGLGNKT